MSDERLREAERRWKESGSVDDEARYLLERVRVGDLTRERLELAGRLGQPSAIVAGNLSAGPPDSRLDVGDDVIDAALRYLDPNEQRLFACDCAERIVRFWSEFAPHDPRPQVAISVARKHATGRATDSELERARSAAEAASWCTALNAAGAAEAAKAAASREPDLARWAAEVAVRVAGRVNAQQLPSPSHVPFQDLDWSSHDGAKQAGSGVERDWQRRRLADYLLKRG